MMTSSKYAVMWTYREGDTAVCRALHSSQLEPCIEAARLISSNPYASEINVVESDTGKLMDWGASEIGRVVNRGDGKRITDPQVFERMDQATSAALPTDYIVAFESIATGTLLYAVVSDPAKMGDRKKMVQMRGPEGGR